MDTWATLQLRRNDILSIAARHGAQNVRVFGSVARGDARPDSDVDFLVDKELVWLFRQLGNTVLENLALSQIRSLAESARQADLKAQYEEIRKQAEERGIELP
jgi:predicted nucleotidyltransferase